MENMVIIKHKRWLQHEYVIPIGDCQRRGRPKKLFSDSSTKTKSRDESVKQLMASDNERLVYATQRSLHSTGKRKVSEVVRLATTATPKSLKIMKKAYSSPAEIPFKPYTPEESLALMIDLNLTKEQYILMQRGAKERGANIYAAYSAVTGVKNQCYPESAITVSETEAKINVQSLLNHTIKRLVQVQREVLECLPPETTEINFIHKWGLDGSGGHSLYKQSFTDPNIRHADSNIVFSNLVPLEISAGCAGNGSKQIYWKNLRASATRACRPIRFVLQKETKENVIQHYNDIKRQIDELEHTEIMIKERPIIVKHVVLGTMFDGKILNILTDNSASQRCYICKSLPKDMNNLDKVLSMGCNENYFDFGVSCLHAYIRSFELFLHISYKLELKEWQARGPEAQRIVKARKEDICQKFYQEMGLIVDFPKQGGGNTNDGNSARRFFSNPEKAAAITGLNSDLLIRFSNILSVLSSGYEIDTNKFKIYCLDTAKVYIQAYEWYPMSVTVHKVLIHSADIAAKIILPIGQLTEDVQEARQKDWKLIRLQHARKTSRINTNVDIMHHLLISSDPVITHSRKVPRRKAVPFTQAVLRLLKEPQDCTAMSVQDEDSSSDD